MCLCRTSTNKDQNWVFLVCLLWWGQETELSDQILAKQKQKWTSGLLSQNPPLCVWLWTQSKAKSILWKLGVMSFPYEIMDKSEGQRFLMSYGKKQNKMYRVMVYFKIRKVIGVKLEDSATRGQEWVTEWRNNSRMVQGKDKKSPQRKWKAAWLRGWEVKCLGSLILSFRRHPVLRTFKQTSKLVSWNSIS